MSLALPGDEFLFKAWVFEPWTYTTSVVLTLAEQLGWREESGSMERTAKSQMQVANRGWKMARSG